MNGFNPYITFDECCEEALHFYKRCFGGEITFIQYYDDQTINRNGTKKVMHSEFRSGPIQFMACDNGPGETVHRGTSITMYISFSNAKEQEDIFERLAEKGMVHMPLESTFWGSRLGVLTDKFGVHWMLVLNR